MITNLDIFVDTGVCDEALRLFVKGDSAVFGTSGTNVIDLATEVASFIMKRVI